MRRAAVPRAATALLLALVVVPRTRAAQTPAALAPAPMEAAITRVQAYVSDIHLDSQDRIYTDGRFLLNTGDPAELITRFLPDGGVDMNFSRAIMAGYTGAPAPPPLSFEVRRDGSLLTALGGTNVDGSVMASEIVLFRPDGTPDPGFSTRGRFGENNSLFVVTTLPDGKILVAGRILSGPKDRSSFIVRLSKDGALDPTFNSGERSALETAGLAAFDIAVDARGRILVGKAPYPNETIAAENKVPRLSMLLPDGRTVEDFERRATETAREGVYAIRIQKDGKIVIGGPATFARLMPDGRRDPTFKPPVLSPTRPGLRFVVRSIDIQPDGKIVAGGDFLSPNGSANGLIRMSSTGVVDEPFERAMGTGFHYEGRDSRGVMAVRVDRSRKIIVGGAFDSVNGHNLRSLVRLNPDGTLDDFPAIAEVGLP